MKIRPFFNLLILVSSFSYSQLSNSSSTAKETLKYINDKFPTTRNFDLQYEQLGKTNYESDLFGETFEKGEIKNHSKLKFASNIKLYTSESKKFFITNSFRYKYESYQLGGIKRSGFDTEIQDQKREFHYFSDAVSATYFSSLFKKPIFYNASLAVDANDKAFQRVKGFASATMILKSNENTTITVGLLAFIDPSVIAPVAPVFSYEHRFANSWQLDVTLPQRVMVKHKLLENGRISLGTELNSENFYLNLNNDRLNGIYELNQIELKSGITYEYQFMPNFIGTFKGGINNVLNSRITERGEQTTKYVIDNKQDAQFYLNVGISYNPF
ncbi:DUF6268 family outer membrane beta-barrel protein [Chryseobacterium sp. LC2016-27]|uniref:DUF6268 family outer membrane beta-barrel protein n=1 Tax=Chryseobacterium sp. LC2016-27 TaxID=2897326 RepID=UPI001E41EA06|nr:DUF6268 family outer membrane beta-barrel protein [Chryseobacterium sp. LC2016-27]MCD0456401.1 DUF6268 family outer membrane beta-barrel protein [Chryseobacterium sp. LC2016-27]